ncbi:MAG: TolC family protein [Bacteroidota bacterium]|jgi:outer membrane protein TolC|nr:TolC family protein [Bacteroidota bacterium]
MSRFTRTRLPRRLLLLLLLLLPPDGMTTLAQPLRLSSLLNTVDDAHPRIRAALAEIDVQRGRKLQAIAPPAPRLTFHEEEIPSGEALGAGAQRIWQLSQEFDLPLLVGARGAMYGHLERAAEYQLSVARAMVRAEIIDRYATWHARLRQYVLLEENQRLAADFARTARLRHDAGESSALEAARARAEEASARIARDQARRSLEEAAAALAIATARDIPSDVAAMPDSLDPAELLRRLPSSEEAMLAPSADAYRSASGESATAAGESATAAGESATAAGESATAAGESATAAGNRETSPLLRSLREERDAARSNASWRWMEFLPRFEASWFHQDFKHLGPHWGAELTASLPLWFILDTRGSMIEHDAMARQAEARYERAAIEIERDVRLARRTLATAAANMRAYTDALILEARHIADAADIGYDSGEVGYMEYLSARQAVNAITIGYHDALAELYRAVARYELVSGIHILE